MTRLIIALSGVAVAAAVTGCSGDHAKDEPPPRPVKVADVSVAAAQDDARYSVSIQPYEQIAVAFKASGYVASVLQRKDASGNSRALQPGDPVSAGMVLARVRDAEYQERVKSTESAIVEIQASVTRSRLDLDRMRKLFDATSATKPELDAAQAAFDAGEARLTSARTQLELARLALADCTLVSPIAGVVLERRVEAGSLAAAGTVAFLLGRVDHVKAVFGVPDSIVSGIEPGRAIAITTEAFPGRRFSGRVTAIAPSADTQSRVFDIETTIANADGRLRPGMIGTIAIPAGTPASTPGRRSTADAAPAPDVVVPLAAIVRSTGTQGGYGVFVVEGTAEREVARARPVTLGAATGNAVAITRGLRSGERVIVMGATLVTDGERVRVIR